MTLTVAIIIITGILGSVLAETACRIFKITEPVARGVAIGTASHAIGTSKAMEMGETEGAISGLSIAVAGLLWERPYFPAFYKERMYRLAIAF